MLFNERDVPRITNAMHRTHALTALALLYWWEIRHLYVYLFSGK
jgi:hypothetical protein